MWRVNRTWMIHEFCFAAKKWFLPFRLTVKSVVWWPRASTRDLVVSPSDGPDDLYIRIFHSTVFWPKWYILNSFERKCWKQFIFHSFDQKFSKKNSFLIHSVIRKIIRLKIDFSFELIILIFFHWIIDFSSDYSLQPYRRSRCAQAPRACQQAMHRGSLYMRWD